MADQWIFDEEEHERRHKEARQVWLDYRNLCKQRGTDWNTAVDYVINKILENSPDFPIPSHVNDRNAQEIYDSLREKEDG